VISASLVNLVCKRDDDREILKTIAAGGFRDITRISSSSPVMWQHICTANRDKILTLIDAYKEQLLEFRQIIEDGNPKEIEKCFSNAKEYRDSLPIKKKGVLPDVFEFYLDLDDKVGGIATIAASLAEQKLSIKNIGIIHNREFQDGVLHIEMYDLESMEKAIEILSKTYRIHRKK
jgi:prephenate dehydrogenase